MTVKVSVSQQTITFQFYGQQAARERKRIIQQLDCLRINYRLKQLTFLYFDINAVLAAGINTLSSFEATFFSAIPKLDKPQSFMDRQGSGYYYASSLGSRHNEVKYHQEKKRHKMELDNDAMDAMDWSLTDQSIYDAYKIKSDVYLQNVFADYQQHLTLNNQFIALAQGTLKRADNHSPLAFIPKELMWHIASYMDKPAYPSGGKKIFDRVEQEYNDGKYKRSC